MKTIGEETIFKFHTLLPSPISYLKASFKYLKNVDFHNMSYFAGIIPNFLHLS